MKNILLVTLVLSLGLISCSKENENQEGLLGNYSETYPQSGRTQMNFILGNKVTIIKSGSSNEDTFLYKIVDNTIKLTPTWDNSSSDELYFELINSSTFKIQNLYPSIPEYQITYITFERQ